MASWAKLGIIAGGGELPVVLAEHCVATHRPYFIARIAPYADAVLEQHPGVTQGLGLMGARIAALREAGCEVVVLLGQVPRPDLSAVELDEGAKAMIPGLLPAFGKGDDVLLRAVLGEFEKAGFRIMGADEVMDDLLAQPGAWGAHAPNEKHLRDIKLAAKVAAAIGSFDVGQGVIVCDGLVLAVEAQEGTDNMLRRVGELPAAVRGSIEQRRGVLVKRPKPIQERRIDLPTIGVRTIEGAAAAGLVGVAVEAGAALAVRRPDIIAAADEAGLYVYGFTRGELGET